MKEEYEKKKEEAIAKFEQEEKALKFEIEKGKEELLYIAEQLQKAKIAKQELEFKINNALETEALYSFIEKRSMSDDYKKHLGIISIIRKDFEILNDLFIGHHKEIKKARAAENFRSKFKRPLQRIILYVDDLDRCPEENVVEVLEAVNLLMAFPLFVVIVGVDPRWVKNALIKKYSLQFTGKLPSSYDVENGIVLIEPSDYLEKIFQVPFHLKDASLPNVKDMIRQLAGFTPKIETISATAADKKNIPVPGSDIPGEGQFSGGIIDTTKEKLETTGEQDVQVLENIEFLVLSDDEINAMQEVGEIVGTNPRALKRYVNIYRIIKAHDEYTVGPQGSREDVTAVFFLLALSIGQFRKLWSSFEIYIQNDLNKDKLLSAYLLENISNSEIKTLKDQLEYSKSEKPIVDSIISIKSSVFNTHNTFIKRFTFKNL